MRPISVFFLATAASAQSNFTTCCDVTPSSVDVNIRLSWCRAQMNTCPLVCQDGQTSSNTCDSDALTYNCTCLTGNTPNISSFAQTLPSLECDEWVRQCVLASPNNLVGQNFCLSFACGQNNASGSALTASPSTTASASNHPSSTPSASGTTTTTSSKNAAAATAIAIGREYGTGVVLAGVFAIFGFAL